MLVSSPGTTISAQPFWGWKIGLPPTKNPHHAKSGHRRNASRSTRAINGLFYKPGSYSNTEEVIELAKSIVPFGGIYDTHLRDESSYNIGLLGSIEEVLNTQRAPVFVFT